MTGTIRTLDLAGIETLLDWAANEGWNPGLNDAPAFQAADPGGFLGAFVDDVMVAGIAAVAYDAHFGFIGLYICHPDWRGQGHGKAVWDAGMAYLGSRTIGLDGVPEQQANYAGMGFVAAYETVRMSGILPERSDSADRSSPVGLEDILELDRASFPSARPGFLKHWIAPPNRAVRRGGEGRGGYAVSRPCRDGFKIGPLFAPDIGIATELMLTQSGQVCVDVPIWQADWLRCLSALGFTPGLVTQRMYRGLAPRPEHSIFGVTSLELG